SLGLAWFGGGARLALARPELKPRGQGRFGRFVVGERREPREPTERNEPTDPTEPGEQTERRGGGRDGVEEAVIHSLILH
ncbi:unnamed protein product, partial [Lampetra planeri]